MKGPDFPIALGVIREVKASTYEQKMEELFLIEEKVEEIENS